MKLSKVKNHFASELLDWYHQVCYEFPWRNVNDPYAIWLSEVMLQQTRVSTVIPYYKRWISIFPDIQSVANSNLDIILKQWEGLGYYARARNFHRACQISVNLYDGDIPHKPTEFSKLPGVGPYISAAVMSIAFNVPVPAIDVNTIRVVSRLNSIKLPYPKSKKNIYSLCLKLIDSNRPGEFNQAVMDLGREICTPNNPSCYVCPVKNHCSAHLNNVVAKYPVKVKKTRAPHYYVAVGIIWKNNRILISKRNESGMLGGLWEFPGGKIKIGETSPDCVIREVQEELDVLVSPIFHAKRVKHAYSHFSITMDAYHCQFKGGTPRPLGCSDFRWVFPHEIQKMAFPSASRKLFDSIKEAVAS